MADIRAELQAEMTDKASVFRTDELLRQAGATVGRLRERYRSARIDDKGKVFNFDLTEALELGYLLDLADALVAAALARTESRGAHFRDDFPTRDDANWCRHSLAHREPPTAPSASTTSPSSAAPTSRWNGSTDPGGASTSGSSGSTPRSTSEPHWETYTVDVDESDRVLDALHQVKWHQRRHPELPPVVRPRRVRLRRHGHQRQEPAGLRAPGARRRVRDHRRAHPGPAGGQGPGRRHGAVLRRATARCCPALIANDEPGDRERLQSPEERARFDDTTKCILCAACTTSCPVYWANDTYVGPAAIVNAHRFIFDSRDDAAAERLDILDRAHRRVGLPHRLQLHRRLPPGH